MKVCKQCGEEKPTESFRRYYGGRTGTYTMCKACEKINSRAKYLNSKGDKRTAEECKELTKIHALWDAQRANGLKPPNTGRRQAVSNLDDMISRYQATRPEATEVPAELLKWLHETLTAEPEYYQETIYEYLINKYRPQVGIDPATSLPVYADTYKDVLNRIASRFDAYEDKYYNSL